MPPDEPLLAPDQLHMRRWFVGFGLYLLLLAAAALVLMRQQQVGIRELIHNPGLHTTLANQILKLVIYALWMSISCTFVPLPTNPVIAALALREVALSPSIYVTILLVATVGALASSLANTNDFYLFSLLLRHKGIARIRDGRLVQKASGWFSRQPFFLLMFFNVMPIPVDVARMLAATSRYSLGPFIGANFLGRWIRYAVIAAVTFELGSRGWISVVALLGIAVIMGLLKALQYAIKRLGRRSAAG